MSRNSMISNLESLARIYPLFSCSITGFSLGRVKMFSVLFTAYSVWKIVHFAVIYPKRTTQIFVVKNTQHCSKLSFWYFQYGNYCCCCCCFSQLLTHCGSVGYCIHHLIAMSGSLFWQWRYAKKNTIPPFKVKFCIFSMSYLKDYSP